ncbi:PH domain-containing protein [Streptomyces sp. HNM0575]|uniref:PH domain-containing protein n=1 Tax=Streptomyces sp. HNM0575 TaxID=2716338 RepID=UPI00145C9487|nr:PH domain-containing protein [Streptomyces sp. HNM0575]NLU72269.1 PH domain-containing protein [Streptomyces sp. HNM0575]
MSSEPRSERERESRHGQDDGSASAPGGDARPPATPEPAPAPEAAAEPAAGPPPPEPPAYADRCYRSPGSLAAGVLLLLLAAWLGTDAVVSGDGHTRLTALAGLVFAVPLVVAFTLRPAVYASAQRLRVRNPFRTVDVPWGTVEGVRSGYSSEVLVAGGGKYQLWSIPVSLRARNRAFRRTERAARAAADGTTAAAPARPVGLFGLGGVPGDDGGEHRAPSDQAIDELRALAADHGDSPSAQGGVTVRWAYEIAAPALLGAIALAVLLAAR